MGLPSELVLMSLRYLNKSDLKNARLVSKQWSSCASEHLFSKLFISPHHLNLQIFVDITRDPRLSKCVKELEYNAVHFSPHITISEYFDKLWRQIVGVAWAEGSVHKDSDPEIHRFVTLIKSCERDWDRTEVIKAEARLQCFDFAFIREGYQRWMEEAHFEKECTENGVLLNMLTTGLKSLSRLRTVRLRSEWSITGKLGCQGSPLARSWNRMHAHPGRYIPESDRFLQACNAHTHFQNLTSALSVAAITDLRNVWIESTIPPAEIFDTPNGRQSCKHHSVSAYSGLLNLKLCLVGWCDNPMVKLYDNLPGVSSMLEAMTALKRFELELPEDYVNEPVIYFPYAKVFPANGRWPHLTTFMVLNLSIGTKDLITLLTKQMPSLRHLTFGNMRLLDGHWEGIVEYLRNSNQLSSFRLVSEYAMLHRGNEIYLALNSPAPLSPIGQSYFVKIRLMMEYVVNGLRDPTLKHPSLNPRQQAHQSSEYLRDVYRLCDAHDAGDT